MQHNFAFPELGDFTGKERDSETGLDFFGARYFSGAQGRFATPDPLMASARASNPQSWNRYSYVLNEPFRHVDPDGMEVPQNCVTDPNCTIQIQVNIIYDVTMNKGKGPAPEQKKKAQREQQKAAFVLGLANVQVKLTETSGTVTDSHAIKGIQNDALNIVVSDKATPTGASGVSGTYDGEATTQIDISDISTALWIPAVIPGLSWTPTLIHEYGEQLLHVGQDSGFFANFFGDTLVDLTMQGVALSMPEAKLAVRGALQEKRYAVPASPEANKPQR